jgi:hypothetical protein
LLQHLQRAVLAGAPRQELARDVVLRPLQVERRLDAEAVSS